MPVPITALYGPLNAFLNISLAGAVSSARRRAGVSLGHGESDALLKAARAHGNNAEFVPLALVMLLIAELCGGTSIWLHAAGGTLLVARVSHALGIHGKPGANVARFIGTSLTWITIIALGFYAMVLR